MLNTYIFLISGLFSFYFNKMCFYVYEYFAYM